MSPTYKLRLLYGDMKSAVPYFYRRHLVIGDTAYPLDEGVKHLGEDGGTLVATPRKACYGHPIRLHVNQGGRIERRAA